MSMESEVREALDSVKAVLTAYCDDSELAKIQAKQAKLLMDALLNEEFTREEAIKIICSQ